MLINGCASRIVLKDTRRVALMIHGFRAVPNIYDELSAVLLDRGFSIYNLRLAGHGFSSNEQMLKTRAIDWEKQIDNVYLDLADRYEEVVLIGLSLGAALIINTAAKWNFTGKAVALAPFLKYKQKFAWATGLAGCLKKSLPPSNSDCSIHDPVFAYFLPAFTLPQVYEVYKVTGKARKNIKKLNCNMLAIIAHNDHALDVPEHIRIVSANPAIKQRFLEKSFHNILQDVEKKEVIKQTVEWLE